MRTVTTSKYTTGTTTTNMWHYKSYRSCFRIRCNSCLFCAPPHKIVMSFLRLLFWISLNMLTIFMPNTCALWCSGLTFKISKIFYFIEIQRIQSEIERLESSGESIDRLRDLLNNRCVQCKARGFLGILLTVQPALFRCAFLSTW